MQYCSLRLGVCPPLRGASRCTALLPRVVGRHASMRVRQMYCRQGEHQSVARTRKGGRNQVFLALVDVRISEGRQGGMMDQNTAAATTQRRGGWFEHLILADVWTPQFSYLLQGDALSWTAGKRPLSRDLPMTPRRFSGLNCGLQQTNAGQGVGVKGTSLSITFIPWGPELTWTTRTPHMSYT